MKRLSSEMIREAMETTGLSLWSDVTLNVTHRCGCPIGILAASIHGTDSFRNRNYSLGEFAGLVGLDESYIMGFVDGFDGLDDLDCDPDDEGCVIGYQDGQTIRRELLDNDSEVTIKEPLF